MSTSSKKLSLAGLTAFAAALLWSAATMAALNIPDAPLFLTSIGVNPNIILTLDDSGSMSWAYIPDSLNENQGLNNRYAKSSDNNPIYYNPNSAYRIPPDATGNPVSSPTFNQAYVDGFAPSLGTVDLRSDYRPTEEWRIGSSDEKYMGHFHSDVRCKREHNRANPCQINATTGSSNSTWINMEDHKNNCDEDTDCRVRTGPAYYYVFDQSNANCNSTLTDNACYDIKIVSATSGQHGTDERQNFTNWYSFYRTRNLTTISATALAFQSVPTTSRVAWQALDSCRTYPTTLVTNDCEGWENTWPNFSNAIKPFSGGHKANFYTWLFRLPANAWRPLRLAMVRAGDYFSTSGSESPYDNDLGSAADNAEYACRRNFHVLMTDGAWNTNTEPANWTPNVGNYDNSDHLLPDAVQYNAQSPYKDGNSNSLADIAFKYWATDLRGNLDNTVPSYVTDFSGAETAQYFNARNDPANWQHLVNFTIGLGLTRFLDESGLTWDGDTYSGSYSAILSGALNWPNTGNNQDGNVADLWHAAINSRGQFYSADDTESFIAAFQKAIDTVNSIAASGGGAGLSSNTTQIDQTGAIIFEATFSADWSGRLLARPVQGDFSLGTEYWDAGQRIPAPYARKIFTINAAAEAFTTCSDDLQTALNHDAKGQVDNLCSKRINWLRGDGKVTNATWANFNAGIDKVTATYTVIGHGFVTGDSVTVSDVTVSEYPAPAQSYNGNYTVTVTDANHCTASIPSAATGPGTYDSGGRAHDSQFRNRASSVLGDIMNSDPVYSAADDDYGYGGGASTVTGKDAYPAFLTAKHGRPPVLYVGANDGMLHGFQADVGAANSGVELLAYVPHGVYDHLSALTDPNYEHKYYVDGPLSVSDAYLGGAWGTYLAGSLGKGGKSIFALDVSDPTDFSEDGVLWEFTDASDLGLTFSMPQIAPITANQWAVVFGNGYNSTNEAAYLYVVDLATGNQLAKVATNNDDDNGLSTPYLYDSDGDRIVDVAYAGDLQGNLWKFLNTEGTWTLGNDGDPLFTARNGDGDVQSITSQPKVAVHPGGGLLVYFGTGSYLSTDDLTNDEAQAFYAIWDKPGVTGTAPRRDLEGYSIVDETTAHGFTVRTTSAGAVSWEAQRGWYLDLPAKAGVPSERIVSTPLTLEFTNPTVPDRVLFVTNTPADDPCSRGGTTWLMELDLITGGPTATSVFDLSGNESFGMEDMVGGVPVSGVALPPTNGITGEPLLLKTEDGDIVKAFSGSTGISGTAGGPLQQGEPPAPPGLPSPPVRLYWRQIL